MNVIVAGGCGFIGSRYCNLASVDTTITVVDDLSLGKKENIKAPNVRFLQGDISDVSTVEEAVKGEIDAVVMMNGLSSNPLYYPDPRRGYQTVLMGALNVLEACRKRDVPRVVYASTSSLYGNTDKSGQSEDARVKPPNFYSAARLAVEDAMRLYSEEYGLTTVGLRNFSVMGFNELHKGVYANCATQFLWEMLRGKSPVIYGDGTQTRDFIFVDDVVSAIRCALSNKKLSGAHVFNIGTGKETSFNEVVAAINRHLGTDIKPIYTPNQIHNYIFSTLADIRHAEELLEWKAEVSFDDAIRRMIDFYKPKIRK